VVTGTEYSQSGQEVTEVATSAALLPASAVALPAGGPVHVPAAVLVPTELDYRLPLEVRTTSMVPAVPTNR
jgi:hypothetical protein